MRRYYDRSRGGMSFVQKIWLVLVILLGLFLFRNQILQYLSENPGTAKYVPSFVVSALERDLEDWRQEDLQARYQQLSTEVELWQGKLTNAADQGQAKFNEVQNNLNEARAALEETKAALDKLTTAGENLKDSVSLGASEEN